MNNFINFSSPGIRMSHIIPVCKIFRDQCIHVGICLNKLPLRATKSEINNKINANVHEK